MLVALQLLDEALQAKGVCGVHGPGAEQGQKGPHPPPPGHKAVDGEHGLIDKFDEMLSLIGDKISLTNSNSVRFNQRRGL